MKRSGLRQSAAALAAMHPVDRRWFLARLPAASARSIAALLPELDALGPVPPDWLKQALDASGPAGYAPPPPAQLIRVVDRLTPVWAARMLAATAPDHVELYLAACPSARAMAVRAALDAHRESMPAGLARELVQELQFRAHTLTSPGDVPVVLGEATA